jgi:hypothetical protein
MPDPLLVRPVRRRGSHGEARLVRVSHLEEVMGLQPHDLYVANVTRRASSPAPRRENHLSPARRAPDTAWHFLTSSVVSRTRRGLNDVTPESVPAGLSAKAA